MPCRQLMTFQEIKGVHLVTEYEKKYLMDQAMADNSSCEVYIQLLVPRCESLDCEILDQ